MEFTLFRRRILNMGMTALGIMVLGGFATVGALAYCHAIYRSIGIPTNPYLKKFLITLVLIGSMASGAIWFEAWFQISAKHEWGTIVDVSKTCTPQKDREDSCSLVALVALERGEKVKLHVSDSTMMELGSRVFVAYKPEFPDVYARKAGWPHFLSSMAYMIAMAAAALFFVLFLRRIIFRIEGISRPTSAPQNTDSLSLVTQLAAVAVLCGTVGYYFVSYS